jgi:hypothetical protein
VCHEDVWGSGYIDPRFLGLGTGWRREVNFTPLQMYPRENSPPYPWDRRLDGHQSRSGRYGEVIILDPTTNRSPIPWPYSPYPVPIPSTLQRRWIELKKACHLDFMTVYVRRGRLFKAVNGKLIDANATSEAGRG